jgi:PAS domain S-box-containing protein
MDASVNDSPSNPCLDAAESTEALAWPALFDLLPQAVLLAGPSGRWAGANPAALRMLGLGPEGLLAMGVDGFLEAAGVPGEAPLAPRAVQWVRPDGQGRWLELAMEVLDTRGRLITLTDITKVKGQEAHLERMTQLYAALSQVNQAIVWSPTREALLDKICEVMVVFGRFTLAWIGQDDPLTHEVRVLASHGDSEGYLGGVAVRSDDSPRGRGGTGTAIRTGQPCLINDLLGSAASAPWHGPASKSRLAASASFPIRQGGVVIGALVVYAAVKDFFGAHEVALLEEAAGDVSFALDHLELDGRRKQAEANLRDSRARLQRAETVAHFGHWELNLAERVLLGSEGACLIYGLPEHALSLQEVQRRVVHEDRPALDAALALLVRGGNPYDVEFAITRASDGERRVIHSVAEYDPARHLVFGVLQDITERKRVEVALKDSEFFFKESQRAAAIGSYKADFITGFWTSSPVLDGIFGIDAAYVRSIQGWLDLVHPEDQSALWSHLRIEVMTEHKLFSKEYRITRKVDGEVRWVKGLGEGTFGEDGVFQSLIGTIQDITEAKRAEEENRKLHAQLQQNHKMESLGTLAGGVAHDMNNVLGAILGLASASLESQPEGSRVRKALGTIMQAAERGGKMVQNLLSFARQKPAELRELDLNSLLQDGIQLLERTTLSRLTLDLDLEPGLRPIWGDPSALAHAFLNLYVNAVDAMPEGGTLSFRTRNLGAQEVEVLLEDTGCGMPGDVLLRALDPFFTTKAPGKGTGLGLSLVYSTVTAHQGTLELRSSPGQGTKVRLVFPAAAEAPAGAPVPAPRLEIPDRSLQALVVDDDELVRKAVVMQLEALGHRVTLAACGEEALAILASGFQPEVVILDLNMPGLGGGGTLPLLRALCPAVPVLLSTGGIDQAALDLTRDHAHVTLLSKPYALGELRETLRAVAGARAPLSAQGLAATDAGHMERAD